MKTELRENIDWVGYIDWTVRDFHGYETSRGSTYNAFLIRDKDTALIDAVKGTYADHLLSSISALIDLSDLRYLICNHAEPDHSGALPHVIKACPDIEVVCNAKCKAALEKHYETADWKWRVVEDGDSLSLGSKTLTFINTPMVHWPESMFTYVKEDKILFSMDAFGQHYASSHRFAENDSLETVMFEARTYFANIVMLYGKPIERAMKAVSDLSIEMIAPSHGVIWRDYAKKIITAYSDWVTHKPKKKVLIVYDTMWKSTEIMAHAIMDGVLLHPAGVEARLMNVKNSHITELATETLDTAVLAVGSPTLNKTLMPGMAGALTYLKGLSPAKKAGFAFGSYGWSKGGAKDVYKYLEEIGCEMMSDEPLQCRFVPSKEVIEDCIAVGKDLAEKAVEKASG